MALRIVSTDGIGHSVKVYDTETGEEVSGKMQITSIRFDDIEPARPIFARIEMLAPRVDITAAGAEITQVCPYCGHRKEESSNT